MITINCLGLVSVVIAATILERDDAFQIWIRMAIRAAWHKHTPADHNYDQKT